MNHGRLCALLCALLLSACAQNASENSLTVSQVAGTAPGTLEWKVQLQVHQLEFKPSDEGYQVTGNQLLPIAQPGEPDLAGAKTVFAIPEGWSVTVDINEARAMQPRAMEIAPFKVSYRCEAQSARSERAPCYDSDKPFPLQLYELQALSTQQGQTLTQLSVHPLQYLALEKKVTAYSQITLTVRAQSPTERNGRLPASTWLSSLVQEPATRTQLATPHRILVITEDAYTTDSYFQQWVSWKTQAGFSVQVKKVSEIGRNAEKILAFVRATPADFLLLVGDQAMVPPFYLMAGWQVASSDYQYARISDENPFPARFVGRVTASNLGQLRTQMRRFVESDKGTYTADWNARAVTIASREGYSPTDVQYAQSIESLLASQGFDIVDRFYEEARNAYPQAIRNVIAEGRGWLSYFGHGSGTAWTSTNSAFNTREVSALTNREKLPMIVDVACDNGAWTKLEPSFSEAWMNQQVEGEPAGSVGYFGGSIKVSWHEPAVMSMGVADYRFRRRAALMGPAVYAGQVYMLEKLGVTKLSLNNLTAYNLFGDPSLLVRTKNNSDYLLNPGISTDSTGRHLTITVTKLDGSALEGLYLGLSSDDKALQRWEVSGITRFEFEIPADLTTPLKLTAYGNGWTTKELAL